MLNVSKRLTALSSKFLLSRNVLNSVATTKLFATKVKVENTFSTVDLYKNSFQSAGQNIYDARIGAFVPVTDEELSLFPEGLAGEVSDEFELISKNSWMIRDSGKLVCRLLDDFTDRKEGNNFVMPKGVATPVTVPFLTNRVEWSKAQLEVSHYGQSMAKDVFDNTTDKEQVNVITMGEGSVVERILTNIRETAKEFPDKILLTGNRGVGKSIIMNQAVLHARKNGWLVLFIPNGWEHAQGGLYVEPVESVQTTPPLYDNCMMSVDALRGFWRAHADKLREIPLKNTKFLNKFKDSQAVFAEEFGRASTLPGRERMKFIQIRAIIEGEDNDASQDEADADVLARFDYRRYKPENLEDLLLFGVAFRRNAGEIFMDLIEELKQVDQFPVLIAVDQYNSWEVDSAFSFGERIHSKNLCVPHALKMTPRLHNVKTPNPVNFELKNGICLMASSLKHFENATVKYDKVFKHLPLTIKVPAYNQVEFLASVCNYSANDVVYPDVTVDDLLSYRMHTASNPRIVRLQAVPYFFPRAVWIDTQRMNKEIDEEIAIEQAEANEQERINDLEDVGYDSEDIEIKLEEQDREAALERGEFDRDDEDQFNEDGELVRYEVTKGPDGSLVTTEHVIVEDDTYFDEATGVYRRREEEETDVKVLLEKFRKTRKA